MGCCNYYCWGCCYWNIHNDFVRISLSLYIYIYICVSCSYSYTGSSSSRMLLALPHWRPHPEHLVSEHSRFLNSLPIVIIQQTTFLVLIFLKDGDKKDGYKVALRRVKSLLESSHLVISHRVIVTTWSGPSSRNPTQSCSIRLNDIRIGHLTLFNRSP